jgi:hypothetical protein
MAGRILYLVGGAPRVGKSTLAQRLSKLDRIPWLPTDVVRTVLRRVLPELDAADQDPVDASLLALITSPKFTGGLRRNRPVAANGADRSTLCHPTQDYRAVEG